MSSTCDLYIDGIWTKSTSGEYFDDLNPYTGEVFAHVAGGGGTDATRGYRCRSGGVSRMGGYITVRPAGDPAQGRRPPRARAGRHRRHL